MCCKESSSLPYESAGSFKLLISKSLIKTYNNNIRVLVIQLDTRILEALDKRLCTKQIYGLSRIFALKESDHNIPRRHDLVPCYEASHASKLVYISLRPCGCIICKKKIILPFLCSSFNKGKRPWENIISKVKCAVHIKHEKICIFK